MTEATVYRSDDSIHVVNESNDAVEAVIFSICDDCGEAYLDPPYYVFDPAECMDIVDESGFPNVPHEPCTGNMCPDCSGPYLTPDDENDPRHEAVLLKNEEYLR